MWDYEIESRLLKRQINKYLKHLDWDQIKEAERFFQSIDEEYSTAKEERTFIERQLNVSSEELSEKNKKLSTLLSKNIQINEDLEAKKTHLKLIIDNVWEWLIVIWFDKKIIEVNMKASVLTGFSWETLIWKKYSDFIKFVSDNKNVVLEDFIENTLVEEKEYSLTRDISLIGRDKKIPIWITSAPVKNYSQAWTACVIVFRDATKQRELDNLKNEFLSVASHELRTPMTVIKGYVSLFIKWKLGAITEKQKTYLEKILNNTGQLIEMVNDMLDVNKLEAGKMEFTYEELDVKNVINETLADMWDLLIKKNIILTSEVPWLIAYSDKRRIEQILINFISNAYKFSDIWWEIHVTLKESKNNEDFVISIKDTGIWIEKQNLWKLFKKFSQVWSHLNKTEKGTGLWLSICKEIAEGMWGFVWVKSIFWEWSTFFVELPINKKNAFCRVANK